MAENDTRKRERIIVQCPEYLPAALDQGARKQITSRSEYVRQALFAKLKADGVDLSGMTGAAA